MTSNKQIKTITFPIDDQNRQLIARKIGGVWQLVERDTLRANSSRFLEVDAELASDLERALAKQA